MRCEKSGLIYIIIALIIAFFFAFLFLNFMLYSMSILITYKNVQTYIASYEKYRDDILYHF